MRNMQCRRGCRCVLTVAAVICGELTSNVFAASDSWTQTAGGAWATASSWSTAAVPSYGDDAVFNLGNGAALTVTLSTFQPTQSLTVINTQLTIDTQNNPIGASKNVSVTATAGQTSGLTVLNGYQMTYDGVNDGLTGGDGTTWNFGGAGNTFLTVQKSNIQNGNAGFNFGTGCTAVVNGSSCFTDGGLNVAGVATFNSSNTNFGYAPGYVAGILPVQVGGPGVTGAVLNLNNSSLADDGIIIGSNNPAPFTSTTNNNLGTFNVSASTISDQPYAEDSGIQIGVLNGSNGTLNITGGGNVSSTVFNVGTSGGTGLLSITGNNSVAVTNNGIVTVGPGGTLHVNSGGTLAAAGVNLSQAAAFNLTGGTIKLLGGQLTISSLTLPATSTLSGGGELTGSLINNGLVLPGSQPILTVDQNLTNNNTVSLLAGKITVDGSFSQSLSGILNILLGEKLTTTGVATLAGSLNVTGVGTLGQSYQLLQFGSESGTFSSVSLPTLPTREAWDTTNLYTSGVISVIAVPEPTGLCVLAATAVAGLSRRRRAAQV